MSLSNEQLASAYAIAKVLGYELSFDEFQKEYPTYYEETFKSLNSNSQLAKCEAIPRPY